MQFAIAYTAQQPYRSEQLSLRTVEISIYHYENLIVLLTKSSVT